MSQHKQLPPEKRWSTPSVQQLFKRHGMRKRPGRRRKTPCYIEGIPQAKINTSIAERKIRYVMTEVGTNVRIFGKMCDCRGFSGEASPILSHAIANFD